MRRRQILAAQAPAERAPNPAVAREPTPVATEMVCPKCGKVLKRHGGHLHVRACRGDA